VDFFVRHYDGCCYMPERGRIHDAARYVSPISPDYETSLIAVGLLATTGVVYAACVFC
jgi:hypothetical protein